MRQQIHRSDPPIGQTEATRREREVRTTFVNAPSGLPCRPEPRGPFDRAAAERTAPWSAYGDPLRATAAAAMQLGGPAVDVTRERIVTALLALAAWVLEPFDDGTPVESVLYTRLVQELAEALHAGTLAEGLGTETARADARREFDDAIVALQLKRVELESPPRWRARRAPLPYAAAEQPTAGALR